MREIRFRGRDKNGRWWYGGIFTWTDSYKEERVDIVIFVGGSKHYEFHRVDPDTVGQFTGFEDKTARDLYENDLCRADTGSIGKIVWHNAQWCWTDGVGFWPMVYGGKDGLPLMEEVTECPDLEVIGNIHEHGHLLNLS